MNVLIGTQFTYRAVKHMETPQFCGQSCHSMNPEFAAYSVSSVTDKGNSIYKTAAALRKVNSTTSSTELWYTAAGAVRSGVTSVTVNTSAVGRFGACADNYSGVASVGNPGAGATGSTTSESTAQTTIDSNNCIVAGMGHAANTGTWTVSAGSLRTSVVGTTTCSATAIMDNTAASPGSVTTTATLSTTSVWAAVSLELRTVIPKTVTFVAEARR